jgi:hypothetical protein
LRRVFVAWSWRAARRIRGCIARGLCELGIGEVVEENDRVLSFYFGIFALSSSLATASVI